MFAEIKDINDKAHLVNLIYLIEASPSEKGNYGLAFMDGVGFQVKAEVYQELRKKVGL